MSTNFKKLIKGDNGSFTVETAIIFSVMFLLIAALVYLLIIMYQYSFLQSVANRAANTGAYNYVNKYYTNLPAKSDDNLYFKTSHIDSKSKKDELNSYISKKLKESILETTNYYDNYTSGDFFEEHLNICLEARYPLPIGNLFKVFGISPTINLKAEAHSPLDKNAEFVRNLDLIIDIKKCISNSDNKWIGKDSDMDSVLTKIFKK